jgi:hypothetical protein
MHWFCKSCWRTGELLFEMPVPEALRIAIADHRYLVDLDMRAGKYPAGMHNYANSPIMDKYPGADCAGDLRIGEPPVKKKRFDRKQVPSFDF